MRDWKIGVRLGAGFGVVLALLVAVWAAAQWSERAVQTHTERAMFAKKVALGKVCKTFLPDCRDGTIAT